MKKEKKKKGEKKGVIHNLKKRAKSHKSKKALYLGTLVTSAIITMLIASIFSIFFILVELNSIVIYLIIIGVGFLLGYLSSKVIEGITHKEKREILAGIFIPLPTVILLTSLIIIIDQLIYTVKPIPSPILVSLFYFIAFNFPYVIYFFEHEKHKHLLSWYLVAPIMLTLVWFTTIVSTNIIVEDSFRDEGETLIISKSIVPEIKLYTEACIKGIIVGRVGGNDLSLYPENDIEILTKEIDYHIETFLVTCINEYDVFEEENVSFITGKVSSDTLIGLDKITSTVDFPISIMSEKQETRISSFVVSIKK